MRRPLSGQDQLDAATAQFKEEYDRQHPASIPLRQGLVGGYGEAEADENGEGGLEYYLRIGGSDLEDEGEFSFFQVGLLSNVAVQLRDRVVRGEHIKGSIPFPNSFTGKDIVVSFFLYSLIRILH